MEKIPEQSAGSLNREQISFNSFSYLIPKGTA